MTHLDLKIYIKNKFNLINMIDKGLKLFDKEHVNRKFKFMKLFDLLVSNKSSSRGESLFLISIACLQLIAGFFNNELKV